MLSPRPRFEFPTNAPIICVAAGFDVGSELLQAGGFARGRFLFVFQGRGVGWKKGNDFLWQEIEI